jgi:hypothetical protein
MQALQVGLRCAIFFYINQAGRIKFDVLRIDDHIHPFKLPQFLDLCGRK